MINLSQVTSFEYIDAPYNDGGSGSPTFSQIETAIGQSNISLIILGNTNKSIGPDLPLDQSIVDPNSDKIILDYFPIASAGPEATAALSTGGVLPSWFGGQNPKYPPGDLISVQYWNPAWLQYIYSKINTAVADGYNGIFLDEIGIGAAEWSPGNLEGNPVYPDATQAMATLIAEIRSYVNGLDLPYPFYIVGNSNGTVGQQFPASLDDLDAVFSEWVYYGQGANGFGPAEPSSPAEVQGIIATLSNEYSGHLVLANDYPPLGDTAALLQIFQTDTSLGWVPSVTTTLGNANILNTGPFMFMATPTNSTVVGSENALNFLSGGQALDAILIGGDQGNYFIGGPGQNMIIGGAGNDTIYPHPATALLKNVVDFHLSTQNHGSTTPSISILVNGQVVVQPTPITVETNSGQYQDFQVNLAPFGPITSVEIVCSGTTYVNSTTFSNVEINSASYNAEPLPLTSAQYSNGGPPAGGDYAYTGNGTVMFPAADFAGPSPFLADTSDTIDGGSGFNTVIYGSDYSNYTVTTQSNGSLLVTSAATAEGPDTLWNVQEIQFADETIDFPPPDSELFWQNTTSGEAIYWTMQGTSAVSTAELADPGTGWRLVGAANFGDGTSDLLWQNTTSGEVDYWTMQGTAVVSSHVLADPGTGWRLEGTTNFGDGTSDLLWQNTTSGEVDYWTMQGTAVVSTHVLANPGTGCGLVGAANFGDGTSDLLWQNTASGEVDYWTMQGNGGRLNSRPRRPGAGLAPGGHDQFRRRHGGFIVAEHRRRRGRLLDDARDFGGLV